MADWLAVYARQREGEILAELQSCNDFTARYGLQLSEEAMLDLVAGRGRALRDTGRVEFGRGVLRQLITAFCDSPYIAQADYAQTVAELLDIFYYFKNESMDQLTDHELITLMKQHFDTDCQGSLDYLAGSCLDDLCRHIREDGFDGRDAFGHLF